MTKPTNKNTPSTDKRTEFKELNNPALYRIKQALEGADINIPDLLTDQDGTPSCPTSNIPATISAPSTTLDEASASSPRHKKPTQEKPHYHGHRDRLRARFLEVGTDGLAEYELLELYLFRSIPRRDTKPLAKALIAKFGSFAEVIAAPIEKLSAHKGMSIKIATELKILEAGAQKLGQQNIMNRPILSSWSALLDYCRSVMQFEGNEQFRVLFLDKKNRLIADEVLGKGTIDRAPVYPREIIKRALAHNAAAIILTHNHPSGDATPSKSDIVMTTQIIAAAEAINISVHDHLIIGRDDIISFKTLGLM